MASLHVLTVCFHIIVWLVLGLHTDGYKMCYSCDRIPFPRDCGHITKCLDNEMCVTEQYISDSGHIWFDTGCISKERCNNGRRSLSQSSLDDISSDITICQECCEGELCNSHGCNSDALPDRQKRGPVCFSCNQQKFPDSCEIVSICHSLEKATQKYVNPLPHKKIWDWSKLKAFADDKIKVCSLVFRQANVTQDPIYSSRCTRTDQCSVNSDILPSGGSTTCTGCCEQDYCNRNCSSIAHSVVTGRPLQTTFPASSGPITSITVSPMTFQQTICEMMNYTYNETLGICYKLYTNITLSWQQARDRCRQDGSDLIVFHSLNEDFFFEAMTKEIYENHLKEIRFWVGATDTLTEMDFKWLDSHPVDPAYFHQNEPNNAYDGEDCLAATFFDSTKKRVLLNDDNCQLPSHFICELNVNTLKNTHDSSSTQRRQCRNADYTYSTDINICYKVFKDQLSMTDAQTRCMADEAELLILRDLPEELYFQHLPFHDRDNNHRYWMGGSRTPDNNFQWFDGSPLNPTLQWFDGEPNNYEKNESCLTLTYFNGDRENFYLNDDNCAKKLYFICEEKCPDTTYRYIPALNMCFKIYNETFTWSEALARCKSDKATLAEVDTLARLAYFQLILGQLAHSSNHKYWVGAQHSTDGAFHWLTTNHMVNTELWHSMEPSAGENCVALHWFPKPYGNTFKLNNRPCGIQDRYICQYIPGV